MFIAGSLEWMLLKSKSFGKRRFLALGISHETIFLKKTGLEMLEFCEKLVAVFDLDNLEKAHDEAIRMTQIKFRHQLDSERLGG